MAARENISGTYARSVLSFLGQEVNYQEPVVLPSASQGKKAFRASFPQVQRPVQTLYPNPSTGRIQVNIEAALTAGKISLYFYDVQGKLVRTYDLAGPEDIIELEGLNTGLYLVKVFSGNAAVYEDKLILLEQ